jgi:hypothetical protein
VSSQTPFKRAPRSLIRRCFVNLRGYRRSAAITPLAASLSAIFLAAPRRQPILVARFTLSIPNFNKVGHGRSFMAHARDMSRPAGQTQLELSD